MSRGSCASRLLPRKRTPKARLLPLDASRMRLRLDGEVRLRSRALDGAAEGAGATESGSRLHPVAWSKESRNLETAEAEPPESRWRARTGNRNPSGFRRAIPVSAREPDQSIASDAWRRHPLGRRSKGGARFLRSRRRRGRRSRKKRLRRATPAIVGTARRSFAHTSEVSSGARSLEVRSRGRDGSDPDSFATSRSSGSRPPRTRRRTGRGCSRGRETISWRGSSASALLPRRVPQDRRLVDPPAAAS